MDDLTFLRQAIELAEVHALGGTAGPFGAVVVRAGEVVGRGWNRVVDETDPTAHAEVLAIREAARCLGTHVLDDCVVYSSCEPCPMCLAAIYWARIPRVVFASRGEDAAEAGFDDSLIAREMSLDWEDRSVESSHALRDEANEVLRRWKEKPDRVEY
ncbi:MAG: nucleoside deaminase [Gemmatimonadota bacterium]|jgi:tRNA(Arg) A34 adenosine deaminase TadA